MGEDFAYGALWNIARDALDAVNALTSAMCRLPRAPRAPWTVNYGPAGPPPDAHEKWQAELKTLPERRAKAVDGIRKAAENLTTLLAEDRFIALVAGVLPPSAPEIARRLSAGLGTAASAARAVSAWKDADYITQPKRHAAAGEGTLRAVVVELERRPEVAEMVYQRKIEKLKQEQPDWPGPETLTRPPGGSEEGPGEVQPDGPRSVASPTPGTAKGEAGEAKKTESTWPGENSEQNIKQPVPKGVSLQDAAACFESGNPDEQKALVKSWRNSRTHQLPKPIGKDPYNQSRNLFEPAALLAFLKEFQGATEVEAGRVSGCFRRVSRPIARP